MLILAVITIPRQLHQLDGSAVFDQLLLLPRMGSHRFTFVWQPIEMAGIKDYTGTEGAGEPLSTDACLFDFVVATWECSRASDVTSD